MKAQQHRKPVGFGLRLIMVICGLFTLGGFAVRSSAEPVSRPATAISTRDSITLRMVQLAQTGHIPEARDVLRDYLDTHSDDGTMLYNLACFDLALSDLDQALIDLTAAFANGYTNFRHMENDQSLKPIRDDPRYLALVEEYETRFRDVFKSRAIFLDEGYPLEDIRLYPNLIDDKTCIAITAGILYEAKRLRIEIRIDDPSFSLEKPFWDGGSGVLINLIHPMSPDDYESRRYFSYGFGGTRGNPVMTALLVARHGENLMQAAPELAPELHRDGDIVTMTVDFPWSAFAPYAPPLDPELGLNIFYLGAGPDEDRPIFSLMPESRLSYSPNPWRRYVPISFYESDRSRPVMRGRLYDRLVETASVDIQLAVWSPRAGPGDIDLQILEHDDTGTLLATQRDEIQFENELNLVNASVDVGALPPAGAFALAVACRLPDGTTFKSTFPFAKLSADWLDNMNERIYRIKGPENELLTYRIHAVTRDLDKRHSQESAAGFIDRFRQVEHLIALCETTGSSLPDSGYFLGGFSGEDNTQRFCAMYLPDGWRSAGSLDMLLIVPPAPGVEAGLAESVGKLLGSRADLVVLVPQSHGYTGLKSETSVRHTELALAWGDALLGPQNTYLVGLGYGSDAALMTSLQNPGSFSGILVETTRLSLDPQSLPEPVPGYFSLPDIHLPDFTLFSNQEHPDTGNELASALDKRDYIVTILSGTKNQSPERSVSDWIQRILENK